MCRLLRQTKRSEDVRRFHPGRCTRRSRRDRHVVLDCHHEGLTIDAGEFYAEYPWNPLPLVSVEESLGDRAKSTSEAAINYRGRFGVTAATFGHELCRSSHPNHLVRGQSARTKAVFLVATVDLGFKPSGARTSNKQGTDTFRPVHLVCTQGHQIRPQLPNVQRKTGSALSRVNMENDPADPRHLTNRADVRDRADLVVHMHKRNKGRVGSQLCHHPLGRNQTSGIRLDVRNLIPFPSQLSTGIQDSLVLHRRGHYVPAPRSTSMGHALNGKID